MILDFLRSLLPESAKKRREEKYREEYRAMSEDERDAHARLMTHYSVYGGPFTHDKMIEMCQAARYVDNEDLALERKNC